MSLRQLVTVAFVSALLLAANVRAADVYPEQAAERTAQAEAAMIRRLSRTHLKQRWRPDRPKRPSTLRRVREENISDQEVREIRAVMLQYYPGTIVNIGAVTEGCHCADGPACNNQVWVVADRDQVSNGLRLSRIGGAWMIGPVQEWWLEYEAYQRRLLEARKIPDREERGRRYQALTEEQTQLLMWAPQCDDPRQAQRDSWRY